MFQFASVSLCEVLFRVIVDNDILFDSFKNVFGSQSINNWSARIISLNDARFEMIQTVISNCYDKMSMLDYGST